MADEYDILIIDDEQVIVDSVVRLCTAEGWTVDSTRDPREGLGKVEVNQYRAIICDIMMPDLDGFQFLEELRERRIGFPVIMTTGYSTVENAVMSLYSGAVDFLAKPFTADELIGAVQRAMNYHRLVLSVPDARDGPPSESKMPYVPCPPRYYRLGIMSWGSAGADGSLRIGVTDLFLKVIGTLREIQLFGADEEIVQGNVCAHVVTDEQVTHSVLSPFTGRIIEQNHGLKENVRLLEKDPYFRGWMYNIVPTDLESESKNLTPCGSDRA